MLEDAWHGVMPVLFRKRTAIQHRDPFAFVESYLKTGIDLPQPETQLEQAQDVMHRQFNPGFGHLERNPSTPDGSETSLQDRFIFLVLTELEQFNEGLFHLLKQCFR